MATFVLVPGAWQGGWCWRRVATLLRDAGHEVFTPTLTGLGERAHLFNDEVDLDTHIQDVLGVLRCEELSEVVLCGHSYGGMVITGVADQAPEQVGSLFYLDALVPTDGQSALDVLPAELAAGLRQAASAQGSGSRVPPAPAEAFSVTAQNQAWVDRQSSDQPIRTLEQPIRLGGAWKQVRQHVYVWATGWEPGIGGPFFERAEEAGWQASSIASGHYVMVDMPEELTRLLIACS